MNKERFAALTDDECAVLFEALVYCIESVTGIGFRSYDQGHPDYSDGAAGRPPPAHSDTPDTNVLFQMMQELSLRLADHPVALIYTRYGLTTWEQFCQFAKASYEARGHDPNHYVPLYLRASKHSTRKQSGLTKEQIE